MLYFVPLHRNLRISFRPVFSVSALTWFVLLPWDNPSFHTLTRLIIVLLHRISYTVPSLFGLVHIWQQIPSDDPYSVRLYLFSQWSMKSSRDIIQLLRAVDITMRPNVQRLIERNVKCHVTFFRQIKFKISIWVCNKQGYTWCLSKNLVHPSSYPIFSGVRVTQSLPFFV